MRKLPRDLGVSPRTARRIINDGLGFMSYRMQRRHLISAASRENRLHRIQKTLEEIRSAGNKAFCWSNDNMFMPEPQRHSQSVNILADGPSSIDPAIRTIFCCLKPAGVMVWATVASDGSKGALVFIKEAVKVNSEVQVHLLEEHALSWVTQSF